MLNLENLKEFTKKYQTKEINVVREYVQHLFLTYLYRIPEAERLLFKGGTALRIIYQSPRFSEDLDFTGQNIYQTSFIDQLFIATMAEIEKTGVSVDLQEAKPTTGGYLGIIHYVVNDISENMKFEVSLRKGKVHKGELSSIMNDYLPSYSIIHVKAEEMVNGKIAALLDRQKPRDYYDFYFILRHPQLNQYVPKASVPKVKDVLSKTRIDFKKELSVLLPVSHQMILKDFRGLLLKEMDRYA